MSEADKQAHTLAYRIGGSCALTLGIAYAVIIALYAPIGAPPPAVGARLSYLAANATRWWYIIGLSVLTDFLFVPLAFSLYLALERVNRYLVLLATACILLFVFLDLTITWTNYASLITLGREYAAAATEPERAKILTAAAAPCAVLQSNLLFVYNTMTLAAGILLSGVVMLRGAFGKSAAWVGIVTGCAGIMAVAASFIGDSGAAIILTSALTTIWVMLVGWKLCTRRSRVLPAVHG